MLLTSIIAYFIFTLIIGILSSRMVKSSNDFILTGQRLPLAMATATVFATWFGSETVLGSSAEMSEKGFAGVIEDPFGASLCLLLVAIFYAKPLYRMKLLTFGDFYKVTFGKKTEFAAGICIIVSYIGWIAAQMVAMGIILNIISGINVNTGIIFTSLIVITYTFIGGMWAVSITDFIQTGVIITGIVLATLITVDAAGGLDVVLSKTPEGYFNFLPESNFTSWMAYIAAWITIGLGSIPQQDVYQRVMSSKSEKVAVRSSWIAALLYLTIALFPLLLGLVAKISLPVTPEDPQLLVPTLILEKTGLFTQILFFGGLLSAIMSTASGALLAPSVILSENILRPRIKNLNDKKLLRITRLSIVIIACISLSLAMIRKDIYELVGEASEISMVSLFVPLTAGLFFKSRNSKAALLSIFGGLAVWICFSSWIEDFPAIIAGALASAFFFLAGSFLFREGAEH